MSDADWSSGDSCLREQRAFAGLAVGPGELIGGDSVLQLKWRKLLPLKYPVQSYITCSPVPRTQGDHLEKVAQHVHQLEDSLFSTGNARLHGLQLKSVWAKILTILPIGRENAQMLFTYPW